MSKGLNTSFWTISSKNKAVMGKNKKFNFFSDRLTPGSSERVHL